MITQIINRLTIILFTLALSISFSGAETLNSINDTGSQNVQPGVYYRIDQGATWGILSDQRMSNLHYQGPGGVLNFGRRSQSYSYITEWSFARLHYNYSRPVHLSTVVENPVAGIRYSYLRKLYTPDSYNIWAGAHINVFGNFRMAGRLGNSYLYGDLVGELRPQAEFGFHRRFFRRDWKIELSAEASLIGYTVRIPEYGVSFELSEDGGVKIQGFENMVLTPFNYAHVTTGLFIKESFRGESNPNWFRIGYVWDYYTMKGKHNLNMHNALHQLVLELYFRIR